MSKPLALSTMFAQQERFADGGVFARFAAAAGYDAIEISHSTRADKLQQILDARALPVVSVHQPAPWTAHADGRGNSKLNLASLDEDERLAALAHALASLDWAARIGATRLVVHLGAVLDGEEMFAEEFRMRRLFDSGRAAEPEVATLREAAVVRRAALAGPCLAAARRSLLALVRAAAPHRVAIGLENRYHYHEIPQPEEYEFLLEGLSLEEAGYWHDVGHAEVLHRLGFVDRRLWLNRLSGRCVGAHLHDVLGLGDHRAPGDGDVDWGYLVAGLRHLGGFTLEINQHQSDEAVGAAPGFLASVGLLDGPQPTTLNASSSATTR
ncbi:MAG: sugar phosphate isomerase/epimerase [Dehalococcoidia bacterium]|nr:sugar phosphate isomerase/epimerase [Dehalococcoidia bacterium]